MGEREATERSAAGRERFRPWLVAGLAGWAVLGVALVERANRQGLLGDVSISPYHAVGYGALGVLAGYVLWSFFRASRRGHPRDAFPPMYGGLGLGFLVLVAWIVVDIAWRNTWGIQGIEGIISPPRLLVPLGLILIASGPIREAVAVHAGSDSGDADRRSRRSVAWAGAVAIGVLAAAMTFAVPNPIREPRNDWAIDPGRDSSELWMMAADGSRQTRVYPALERGIDYSLPAWSPDGSRVAFTAWVNNGGAPQNFRSQDQTTQIWTIAADGSDARLVVDGAPDNAWIPAWSPDGTWISYSFSPNGTTLGSGGGPEPGEAPGAVGPPVSSVGSSVWLIHPDGTGKRRLTPEGVDALGAVWSPDGTAVAYTANREGGTSDIHVASYADGALRDDRTLAADPADDWNPAWSPDGRKVLFTSNRGGNDDLWLASVDGGEVQRITDDPGGDWVGVFKPDGSTIAWVSDRSGDPDVWAMPAGGGTAVNLSRDPAGPDGDWGIAYSPDGSRIAYAFSAFPDPATSFFVRADLVALETVLLGLILAVAALLVCVVGAPFGAFTLAALIVTAVAGLSADQWRFLPGAVIAGVLVDLAYRAVRPSRRSRIAAAGLPGLTVLAISLTIALGGTFAWSITLALGVAFLVALIGWGLADLTERLAEAR